MTARAGHIAGAGEAPTGRLAGWVPSRIGPRAGKPCTPRTRRCDFWNWGPGYLRPACCTSHLRRLTEFTHALLDRHEIFHWLDYGSLLGAVRDGTLIPWDSDVDMGILSTDVPAIASLAPEIERAGYRLDSSDPYVLRINLSEINTQHVDIFPWTAGDGFLSLTYPEGYDWPGMKGRQAFAAEYVEQLELVVLEGIELPSPSPVERFLAEHRYGPGYRTPVRAVQDPTLYPDIGPGELTPALLSLFEAVARTESELLAVERRRARRLARTPVGERWLRSAMPTTPASERVERRRRESAGGATGAPVERLLESLALLDQALDECASPRVRTRIIRAARRVARLRFP